MMKKSFKNKYKEDDLVHMVDIYYLLGQAQEQ